MRKKLWIKGLGVREFYSIYEIRRKYGKRIARIVKPFCIDFKGRKYLPVEVARIFRRYKFEGRSLYDRYKEEQLKEELRNEMFRWAERLYPSVQGKNGATGESSCDKVGTGYEVDEGDYEDAEF